MRDRWLIATPMLLVCLGFVAGLSVRSCPRAVTPTDDRRTDLRDSIHAHRWADSAALVEYGRTIERMRGDSLAALLSARATAWRTRRLPGRVDTVIARDTVRDSVLVAGADVRACLMADSALVVRIDSLSGELVQARYDADQCADDLRRRPTTCGGWTAFGLGVAAGIGACVAISTAP